MNGLWPGVLEMDIRVEGNGLGFIDGGQRWWVFLDGILSIKQIRSGLWTIQHYNGTVIHIPVEVITAEQLDYLRAAAARGRTPEGVQAVIERGRWIQAHAKQSDTR